MKISLHYTTQTQHKTAGAFIRGNSPYTWLQQINNWGLTADEIECYLIPHSVQSPLAAGLFVLFKDPLNVKTGLLTDAYGVVAGKLFIPVHSKVYPECHEKELEKILMWQTQVFHPTIGVVGFEKEDVVDWGEMFRFSTASQVQWNVANAGNATRPRLHTIQVMPPSSSEVIDKIQSDLQTKPLDEIPGAKEAKTSAIRKIVDLIKYGTFKGLHGIIDNLSKIGGHSGSSTDKDGKLEQLKTWLKENIDELEKKRQDEIQRLLKMFDTDTDEALQYAIPLDSKYADRGKSLPTGSLAWRSTNFNLFNLGGGAAVDGWDLGDRYFDLRSKYLAAAQKQVDKGDFKKAAYIYAHLLADYHSAANVLSQGKFYREAAALYKDHLHNRKAAAECLENGGLLTEAIVIYKDLEMEEKTGDLYVLLNQEKAAATYFEKTVNRFLQSGNYLEASRVLLGKKQEPGKAKHVLLEGWQNSINGEPCLQKFFDVVAVMEPHEIKTHIETVYKGTPINKQRQLLNVLAQVKKLYADGETSERTVDIAYEIVSDKAHAKDFTLLNQIKQFVPGDRLLSSDISRYVHNQMNSSGNEEDAIAIQLDPGITWMSATWHLNQVIIVGTKENRLHIARCNWYKNIEYYPWPNEIRNRAKFTLVSNPYFSNKIIISSPSGIKLSDFVFKKNKYFNQEIIVADPTWLPSSIHPMMINSEGGITVFQTSASSAALHFYAPDGKLMKIADCKPRSKDAIKFSSALVPQLFYNDYYFYTATSFSVIAINTKGVYSHFGTSSGIRLFAVSNLSPEIKLVVSTNAGCILLKRKYEGFEMQGNIFATDHIPSIIQFISADRFVLAENLGLDIFEINEDGVSFVRRLDSTTRIVAVIPSGKRDKFAIVEESGYISLHEI